MANELSITYNGQTKTKDSGVVLNTAGRVMATNMTITVAGGGTPSFTNIATATTNVSGAVVGVGSTNYYVSSLTIPSGKSLTVENLGTLTVYDYDAVGNVVVSESDYAGQVTADGTVVYDAGLITANPAFDGGGVSGNITVTYTPTNTSFTTSSTSGISVAISTTSSVSRASVLYNGAVSGWVTKADDATALSSGTVTVGSKANIAVWGIGTRYVDSVTVPTGKTFTVNSVIGTMNVTSVGGTVNINGGAADKGVQIKANKVAVVDSFTVTYGTTTTVNGVTFYAGDLKVPVLNGTTLVYPDPGIYSQPAGTTSMSIAGTVSYINDMTVKDINAVTGSGTASTAYTNYYLAKWNTSSSLTTGPHVTISTSTPSGGSNGDVHFQILS